MESLKQEILEKVRQYYQLTKKKREWEPGKPINFGGTIADEEELMNLVDEAMVFWMTAGQWTLKFEKNLARYLNANHALAVNSGSSANLLAFTTLTSWKLGDRRIQYGDEVITVAAGFPTTVTPIIQYGAIPVFVDVDLDTLNISIEQLKAAITPKTKAVMVAHTLGNPMDAVAIRKLCDAHGLWFIEDNCDALGSSIGSRKTGTFGHLATQSFYPPHHITTGEGGAVIINDPQLYDIAVSIRNWGRDCSCYPGQDNRCGKRHSQQHGKLPFGYDHKYVCSHFGYNLKFTDMQAAIGCKQLERLPGFVEARKKNWKYLREQLSDMPMKFMESLDGADPSYFGFTMILPTTNMCAMFAGHLESKGIQTRRLFMGNMIKQPCFTEQPWVKYEQVGELQNTDIIMNRLLWVGVYPGITAPMLDYMVNAIREFYAAK